MARQKSPTSNWLYASDSNEIIGFRDNDTGIDRFLIPIPHEPMVYGNTQRVRLVQPAATFLTPTYDDDGGQVRLTGAGVHGLTNANAQGQSVYVTWTGGTAESGLYEVADVDTNTDEITLVMLYATGLGTPVVSVVTTDVPLAIVTIPANRVFVGMSIELNMLFGMTASTNNKVFKANIGSAPLGNATLYSQTVAGNNATLCVERQYCVRDDYTIIGPAENMAGHGVSTVSVLEAQPFGGVSNSHVFSITASLSTADEVVFFEAWKLKFS